MQARIILQYVPARIKLKDEERCFAVNIDDRLEALTQSLELLASRHRDSEKRMEQITRNVERVSENVERQSNNVDRLSLATERNTQGNARLEDLVTQIAEGTARLLHVAEVHERRISDLEGRQPSP